MDPLAILAAANGDLWTEALKQAVNLGLIGVMFVIVVRFILNRMSNSIDRIERKLTAVENDERGSSERIRQIDECLEHLKRTQQAVASDITSISQRRTCCIRDNRVFLDEKTAEAVIKIGLDRNASDVLSWICTNLLWRKPSRGDHEMLCRQIRINAYRVLDDTRQFFDGFTTLHGHFRKPLEEYLPMSDCFDGNKAGDETFRTLVGRVAEIIESDKSEEDKLNGINAVVNSQRLKAQELMTGWLTGKTRAAA